MDIRRKLHPYPVLAYYTDDYVNSSFEVIVDSSHTNKELRLQFICEINNDGIVELIQENKAKVLYHLECAQTGYRKVLLPSLDEISDYSSVISHKDILGTLQVCPFIVAATDINNYRNESFHEDFRGYNFNIESGCIIAVGDQTNFEIDSQRQSLEHTPSVFVIISDKDEESRSMKAEMLSNKIVISLPNDDFNKYFSIKDVPDIQPLLHSLVIVPVLTDVLHEISKRDGDDLYEYDSYAWYRAINRALEENYGFGLESTNFRSQNILLLAQNLINSPLGKSLSTIIMTEEVEGDYY